jgi:hypothetical protein
MYKRVSSKRWLVNHHQSGFIPLTLLAFLVGYTLELNLPVPEPVTACLMKHRSLGRDDRGVTLMEHWKPCNKERSFRSVSRLARGSDLRLTQR